MKDCLRGPSIPQHHLLSITSSSPRKVKVRTRGLFNFKMSKIVENQQEASENGQYEPKAGASLSYSMRRRLDGIVDLSLANVPLLACCFITGLLDTTMFQGENY